MLLSEASGGAIGPRHKVQYPPTDLSFGDKTKLLAELNRTLLVANKVDPEGKSTGLDDMRALLNGDTEASSRGSSANGASSAAAAILAGAAESDEPTLQ